MLAAVDPTTWVNLGIAMLSLVITIVSLVAGGVWIVGSIKTIVAVAVTQLENLTTQFMEFKKEAKESIGEVKIAAERTEKELEGKIALAGSRVEHRVNEVGRQLQTHGEAIVRLETLAKKSDTINLRKGEQS